MPHDRKAEDGNWHHVVCGASYADSQTWSKRSGPRIVQEEEKRKGSKSVVCSMLIHDDKQLEAQQKEITSTAEVCVVYAVQK